MIEEFNFDHQPCILSGMYDLECGFGILNLQLPSKEYLKKFDCWSFSRMFDHYNHYMWALYEKEVKWHSSKNNIIKFENNIVLIDIDMDSNNGYVKNISLDIKNVNTFFEFMGIFQNKDFSIKYCKTYRQWNLIEDMKKSSGIEIEINSPKDPSKRRQLIKNVKEHFGNFVYCETEAHHDFPIEFTSNVVDIDNLEDTYDIVEFLLDNGCMIGEYSNIHIHISSKIFGDYKEEIIDNIHKILILDYYHGKKEKFISNVTGTFFYTDDMCKKYNLYIESPTFVEDLHSKFHDKNSSTKEDIYPRIDYFKWLRDPNNYHSIEFKWCLLKDRKTFNDSIKLLRQYLSIIKYSKDELLNICKSGNFESIFK